MKEMPFYRSTFFRFTMVFFLLGLLPILLLLLGFYVRYRDNAREVMDADYTQMNYWLAENIESLIDSVDETMGYMYDFSNDDYGHLYEAVKDRADERQTLRDQTIYQMLREMRSQNPAISSIRFVDRDGQIYTSFSDQGKSLIEGRELFNGIGEVAENDYRNLFLRGTVAEANYCLNSDDYVFTLARNLMDTSRVDRTRTTVLGTFYVDIDVSKIAAIEGLAPEADQQSFVTLRDGSLLYSRNPNDYDSTPEMLLSYLPLLTDAEGSLHLGSMHVYYRSVADTDAVIVTVLPDSALLGGTNRALLLFIAVLLLALLLSAYVLISRRLSDPVRSLAAVMEQVKSGDLTARAEVKGEGEMRILSEGFNRMVDDLSGYIDRMYVAELRQKESELSALKMQIRPHYLYNTLDVIRMTAIEKGDTLTAELLLSLSSQLRYVMGTQGETVRLSEELDNIRSYFVITRVRFENRFSLSIDVSDDLAELSVLKLILQPFVENSVRHGLRPKSGPGNVAISAAIVEEKLVITIMDDGVGISEEAAERLNRVLAGDETVTDTHGVGMKNVADRIRLNCGAEYGVTVTGYEGMGTIAKLTLPILQAPDAVSDTLPLS